MGKRAKASTGSFAVQPHWRCLIFWAAPVGFLLLKITTAPHGEEGHDILSTFPAIALLLATSLANLGADCWFRCRGGLLSVQLLLQFLIVAYYTDLISLVYMGDQSAAAPAEPAAQQPEPQQQLPVTQHDAATPDTHWSPLLARGRPSAHKEQPPQAASGEEPEQMSIVLPCLNETRWVVNTVRRFCERTPQQLLHEIIVVDDGSTPPLKGELQKAGIEEHCRLRVLRHEKPWGLMIAKQTGGDAALGKYIGFYDCHVSPAEGWYRETMDLLQAAPRRLVVPMIGDLDMDTWDERQNGALTAKCYINFNADFWWYDDESDNIPVISGGLVATSRAWWQLSGGFDKGMRGWGGENTDQSLRAWLCGGDVLRAKSSRIAHMWRVPADKRTLARYKLQGHTDNLGRVAAMWFDEFKVKFREGHLDHHLDVRDGLAMRQRLECKPFVFFLHRFRRVYVDGGILPDKVFKIRAEGLGRCLQRHGGGYQLRECSEGTWFHMANMIPRNFPVSESILSDQEASAGGGEVTCGAHKAPSCAECPQGHGAGWCHVDCVWNFGACVNKDKFERQQKQSGSVKCGSGIREWNTLDCFDRLDKNGPLPYNCDVTGKNENQQYLWDSQGHIRHFHGKCLIVGSNKKLQAGNCDESSTRWERIQDFVPQETKLYHEGVKRHGLTEDMPDH